MDQKITAGFVGFGEVNTPREIIEKKCRDALSLLKSLGIVVRNTGPVSDDPAGSQADRAIAELKKDDFDFLVVCVAGWIPSWAVLRVIEPFKHKPMLLWGLTGYAEKGRFVTTADQAGTTALNKPLRDMNFRFKYMVNRLGEKANREEILSFARAAAALEKLRRAKIGMAGYRDMRLYGTLYDGVSLKGRIGPEIEHFDLLEIVQLMESLTDADIAAPISQARKNWKFIREPKPETLRKTARLYLALKHKIEERGYEAISYSDVDGVKKLIKFAPAGALTLLHDNLAVCSIPENDSMGAVTQLMTRFLTGQAAAYLEFYEFTRKGALMGVPDYVPGEIVAGKVTVLPNAFGDFGEGLLNVSKLKTGRVTIARLGYNGNDYYLHVMTGTAKTPLRWEEAGWAPPAPLLPSLEIDFDSEPEDFIQNVLGQHYILAYGDQLRQYRDLCSLLDIRLI
jgi:L-fucose isomerase-like protein